MVPKNIDINRTYPKFNLVFVLNLEKNFLFCWSYIKSGLLTAYVVFKNIINIFLCVRTYVRAYVFWNERKRDN